MPDNKSKYEAEKKQPEIANYANRNDIIARLDYLLVDCVLPNEFGQRQIIYQEIYDLLDKLQLIT
jgi:hypothetical protein